MGGRKLYLSQHGIEAHKLRRRKGERSREHFRVPDGDSLSCLSLFREISLGTYATEATRGDRNGFFYFPLLSGYNEREGEANDMGANRRGGEFDKRDTAIAGARMGLFPLSSFPVVVGVFFLLTLVQV